MHSPRLAQPMSFWRASYGAHLAFAFATKHPDKISKVIALNGATNAMGFVLQTKKKNDAIYHILSRLNASEFNTLIQIVQSGEAKISIYRSRSRTTAGLS